MPRRLDPEHGLDGVFATGRSKTEDLSFLIPGGERKSSSTPRVAEEKPAATARRARRVAGAASSAHRRRRPARPRAQVDPTPLERTPAVLPPVRESTPVVAFLPTEEELAFARFLATCPPPVRVPDPPPTLQQRALAVLGETALVVVGLVSLGLEKSLARR